MKKILLLFVFACSSAISYAQTDFNSINLDKASDYTAANKYALEASNILLSLPIDTTDPKKQEVNMFIIRWMTGTSDFTFSLDETLMNKVVGDDTPMLGILMACMTKYCLENEANAKNDALVKLNSVKLVLAYCEKKENNVKMHRALKKLAEANKKGELEKALQ